MYSKLKKIILKHSNSYQFYKNNYEKLLLENENQNKYIKLLKKENKKFDQLLNNSNSILATQNENKVLLDKINHMINNTTNEKLSLIGENIKNSHSSFEKENKKFDQLLNNSNTLLATQNENKILLDKINHMINNTTNEKLSMIEENTFKIDKSTTHTNIKIDSRFIEQERYIKNLINQNLDSNFDKD